MNNVSSSQNVHDNVNGKTGKWRILSQVLKRKLTRRLEDGEFRVKSSGEFDGKTRNIRAPQETINYVPLSKHRTQSHSSWPRGSSRSALREDSPMLAPYKPDARRYLPMFVDVYRRASSGALCQHGGWPVCKCPPRWQEGANVIKGRRRTHVECQQGARGRSLPSQASGVVGAQGQIIRGLSVETCIQSG